MRRWLVGIILMGLLLVAFGCAGSGSPTPGGGPVVVDYTAARQALALFNHYRIQAAVPPVLLDADQSFGCQSHAEYLDLNDISLREIGLEAHHENVALPGYSQAGADAGPNSVIYEGVTPTQAIENWMSTFYHRIGMLNPNLMRIGFGSSGDYQVMDIVSGVQSGAAIVSGTALFPSPGLTGISGKFKTEIPYPIPGDDSLGIPITVEFFGAAGQQIYIELATLHDLTTGHQITCYVQTPGNPFLEDWDYRRVVALLPTDPLPAGHVYRAAVTGIVDTMPWMAEWDFGT